MGGPEEHGPRSLRPLPGMRRPHARKESHRVSLASRASPEGPSSQNRRLGRRTARRPAVRGPQPLARRAVHACQAAAQGPPPFIPGRGVAKRRGHRPGRWRYSPMVAMAAAAVTALKCHLRSRGCMPGEQAAGTAAGLAPRGGRGLRWLHSGPPPPPQAPAPAAAGRCGMSRVARYIPGAPRLGPTRPRRRHSAGPPASPEV